MKNQYIKQPKKLFASILMLLLSSISLSVTIPADLMRNCKQWKITYPDGKEVKPLCTEPSNEYYYVSDAGDAIVFFAPVRSDNGTTPRSTNIRSELRERDSAGNTDIYWTTTGRHFLYVKQAITHLPLKYPYLVASQIHGNKADGIDDAMVMRLEKQHLFLTFNGGKLRSNISIKTDYVLGTKQEVIFEVIDNKHYVYYSEDGKLLSAYQNGSASAYQVKDGTKDYVMELAYDQSYFKVGNYTQSNATKEGDLTDDPNNYGEVYVYDFFVEHGYKATVPVATMEIKISPTTLLLAEKSTSQLTAIVIPSNATNKGVSYKSSNTTIATVSSTGLVTGIAAGKVLIIVTTDDGSFKDTATVTVKEIPQGLTNIALNKTVTATGTLDVNNPNSNLVDGSTETRLATSEYPQSITVNLGDMYDISYSELIFYEDRAYKYTISTASNENGPYTVVADRSTNTAPSAVSAPLKDVFTSTAQYVQITVTSSDTYTGTWISISEFRVFGAVAPSAITTNQTISLETGWNLVSLYVNPAIDDVEKVFPHATNVKTNEVFYNFMQASYLNSLTRIHAGEGYLVQNATDETITISGTMSTRKPASDFASGWSLIGIPSTTALPLTMYPSAISIKDFEGYYVPNNTQNSIIELEPGKAYFILTK